MQEESTFDRFEKDLIPNNSFNNGIESSHEKEEDGVDKKHLNIDARRRVEEYIEQRKLERLIGSDLENL